MEEKELKRLLKKYDEIECRLILIDERVEKSLRVNKKTLEKTVTL
jgi:hypothetical protein